jgi:hypothetical protein
MTNLARCAVEPAAMASSNRLAIAKAPMKQQAKMRAPTDRISRDDAKRFVRSCFASDQFWDSG